MARVILLAKVQHLLWHSTSVLPVRFSTTRTTSSRLVNPGAHPGQGRDHHPAIRWQSRRPLSRGAGISCRHALRKPPAGSPRGRQCLCLAIEGTMVVPYEGSFPRASLTDRDRIETPLQGDSHIRHGPVGDDCPRRDARRSHQESGTGSPANEQYSPSRTAVERSVFSSADYH